MATYFLIIGEMLKKYIEKISPFVLYPLQLFYLKDEIFKGVKFHLDENIEELSKNMNSLD